jgi:hypothetical protein
LLLTVALFGVSNASANILQVGIISIALEMGFRRTASSALRPLRVAPINAASGLRMSAMAEIPDYDYITKEALRPDWNTKWQPYDWKNHIGRRTQALWNTFTDEQKVALAADADDRT